LKYGINNSVGIPSAHDVEGILNFASDIGINILDTASGYGNAEETIGNFANHRFKIVSKFTTPQSENELLLQIKKSLSDLKVETLYGYLAHNANTLIQNPEIWKVLENIKRNGLVEKIGYSLYSLEQLDKLLSRGCYPDLVQIPYSILDRKFEKKFSELSQNGVEIHVRSVFLQGLYFLPPSELPEKLKPLSNCLQELHKYCKNYNIPIGVAALNFVNDNPYINQVVIGVESVEQLEDNFKSIVEWKDSGDFFDQIRQIKVENSNLLNPSNW
jgi:aryl-alcohol dehydrogenase-like predicted oxidoreductase